MRENLEYLITFARFPFSLRRFLRHRLTMDDARRKLRDGMDHREENFLQIVERSIYGYPRSPYLALLKMAGCELGDLRALVRQRGLEGALRELRDAGVYTTYEELKGRKPIVRNRFTLPVTARDFDNPFARRDFDIRTGGSTGLAQSVNQNLDSIADEAPFRRLMFQAHGIFDAPLVLWSGFLPGVGFRAVLSSALMQQPIQKWFAPSGWRDSRYWYKYSPASLYMIGCLHALGYRVPFPQIVRIDRDHVVARHLHQLCRTNPACVLHATVSRALRVCLAAREQGLDLTRLVIWAGGEPATPAKIEQIRQSGARFISSYAMKEAGLIGYGCPNTTDATDVHLQQNTLALFSHPHKIESSNFTVPAFNITTLLNTASKILLNAQIDDYGIVEDRACGCEMGMHGCTTHLRDIHSYSKLVGEGVTLIGNEMIQILEQTLPARFGGSSLDYQLLEQEDERGLTRLYLLISPRVEIRDEQQVLAVMHQALSASSPMADAARTMWQHASTLQIRRQEPILTATGKLLPLHIQRPSR
jgi:hypothetical protein